MNLVVKTSPWRAQDLATIFAGEEYTMIGNIDLSNLAVNLGAYASTSKARATGRKDPIPLRYAELKLNKKLKVYIWNPSE